MNDVKQLEWTRRDRMDRDPVWCALVGEWQLIVDVPGTPWMWAWEILDAEQIELARGDLCVMEDGEPVDDLNAAGEEWNYQDVELAQARCEAVAWALLATVDGMPAAGSRPRPVCPTCRSSTALLGLEPFCSATCLHADPLQSDDPDVRRRLADYEDRSTGAGGPGGMVSSHVDDGMGWYLAGSQDERAAFREMEAKHRRRDWLTMIYMAADSEFSIGLVWEAQGIEPGKTMVEWYGDVMDRCIIELEALG